MLNHCREDLGFKVPPPLNCSQFMQRMLIYNDAKEFLYRSTTIHVHMLVKLVVSHKLDSLGQISRFTVFLGLPKPIFEFLPKLHNTFCACHNSHINKTKPSI